MGRVQKPNLGGFVWSALVVIVTGCHSFDWVSVEDRSLAEAIVRTQPFQTPLSVEVEARVAATCATVVTAGIPRTWIALRTAGVATLESVELSDGSTGCALTPARTSASSGKMAAWKLTDSGQRWKIPVGMYALNGTGTFESIVTEQSVIRAGIVVVPWTFYPFGKMEPVVLAHTTAAERGMKGQARAELARTADGWRVVGIEMGALQPR